MARWRSSLIAGLCRSPLLFIAALASCSPDLTPTNKAAAGAIPEGAVALVAGQPIAASLVAALATQRSTSARGALDELADDARFAAAAEQRGLGVHPSQRLAQQAVLVRALLHSIEAETRSPITADELARTRTEHWTVFDRPESVRVIHAVAIASEDDPALRKRAAEVARAVAEAVKGAENEADFKRLAEAVPHEGVDLRVESLQPVARDGRLVTEEGGAFDERFTEAAFLLHQPKEHSPVTETRFGYHVMLLLERQPAYHMPDDELRATAGAEIFARRATAQRDKLLQSLRASAQIATERSADEAMRQLIESSRVAGGP